MVDAPRIGFRRYDSAGEQSLHFGRKEKLPANLCPVQRHDPHAIPSQKKHRAGSIPQGKSELTFEPPEHRLAMILPEVDQDLAIAPGPELMPASFQQRPLLDVIEEFPVRDDHDRAVFVEERLLSVFPPDDAKSTMGQTDFIVHEKPFSIRPAMRLR